MAEKRESNKEKYPEAVKPLSNSLKVKLELDCTEALKGLKAVTRAAKKATAALKELEEQINKQSNHSVNVNLNGQEIAKRISSKWASDKQC
ncbi:hypothetical protein [Bacillus sp. FJAT-29814]|uniref:hypothetical protein n=1 Tax=Bacillus sp. FJAT-29814 TaxID=1729688 RepID=UPI00082C7325|nr:hypothetical protein [Bacillus sp. FJAT-29814]